MTTNGEAWSDPGAPHVLYVAWGYPPARSAGMYRALATANAFAKAGWRVTVLTTTQATLERLTGTDPATEEHIDSRINVVRVPFEETKGAGDLQHWSRWRVFSPLAWNFARAMWSQVPFPEPVYGSWRTPLVKAADRIHAHVPVDLVVGSANPNVDFAPGDYLHRRYGVPYVMDYRDTWHLSVYSGRTIGPRWRRSRRLERRLLKNACEAWFVNDAILGWHAKMHPDSASRFHVLANGYDANFIDGLSRRSRQPGDGLVFGFLGTVYGPMPLRETLEGWRLARNSSAILRESELQFYGRLGHYAEPDATATALLDEFAHDGIRYVGPISKSEVARTYSAIDALVLILGRSKYVTSGKVFEYASTGLPILALHHRETAATATLDGYPHVFAVEEPSPRNIADAFTACAEQMNTITDSDVAEARKWAQSLSRDAQLEPRVAALRSLVTARSKDAS